MKKLSVFLFLLALTVILCACIMTACNRGDTEDMTNTSNEIGTSAETDVSEVTVETTVPETPTESMTDAPVESKTELIDTEEVTEAPTPALMTVVDMDLLDEKKASSYFTRNTKCQVTLMEDEVEGKFVRLSTNGISSISTTTPTVYFMMGSLVNDVNGIMPSTLENPYLVLKVRGVDLWSHICGLQAGTSSRDATTLAPVQYTRLDQTDEWQYIYFDLTGFDVDLRVFYLAYEFTTAQNGESMDIAEARLVATEEEAIALAGTNTYPVEDDRTMDEYTLKVVSYNVWAGAIPDWEIRADILSDFIDTYRPDSIGMQEVSIKWRELMDSVVFNESYAGVGELRIPGAEYDAIYYRKDKFDLIDTGTFWLSDTPDVMGSTHPDANAERICTWARLKDKQTGFEYVHVNTHLDNNGKNDSTVGRKVRLSQARVILEFIHSLGDVPVILTGDFNQAHTSSLDNYFPLYKNITGISSFTASDGTEITVSLADARENASDTVSPTEWASMVKYHKPDNSAYNPAHKPIDHIFYSPTYFEPTVFKNLIHDRNGYHTSDHIPQYAEFLFKAATDAE